MMIATDLHAATLTPWIRNIRGRASVTLCTMLVALDSSTPEQRRGARVVMEPEQGFVLYLPNLGPITHRDGDVHTNSHYKLVAFVRKEFRRNGLGAELAAEALAGVSGPQRQRLYEQHVWRGNERATMFWRRALGAI